MSIDFEHSSATIAAEDVALTIRRRINLRWWLRHRIERETALGYPLVHETKDLVRFEVWRYADLVVEEDVDLEVSPDEKLYDYY